MADRREQDEGGDPTDDTASCLIDSQDDVLDSVSQYYQHTDSDFDAVELQELKAEILPTHMLVTYDNVLSRKLDPVKYVDEYDDSIWFSQAMQPFLRFVPQFDEWIVWHQTFWSRSQHRQSGIRGALLLADIFAENYLKEAQLETYDPETLKSLQKRHAQLKSINRAKRVAEGASVLEEMWVKPTQLDSHPDLLNCSNGILDLKRQCLIPHDRKYFLTQKCPVRYEPEATAPLWEAFIREVTCGNEELAEYLQRLSGYVATGQVGERQFWVLYGRGKNGKSTFLNTLSEVLGRQYTKTTPFETFTKKNQNNPELADVMGARLVIVEEGEEGAKLAMDRLKSLVGGGGYQQVRRLYENPQTLPIRMKIMIATNHLPTFEDTSEGTRDRLRVIPFKFRFEGSGLKLDKLRELLGESSGILNWVVEGNRKWREQGLTPPQIVMEATDQAMRESDPFREFYEDHCRRTPNGKISLKDIHARYSDWCRAKGVTLIKDRELSRRLQAMGLEKSRNMKDGSTGFMGLTCEYSIE